METETKKKTKSKGKQVPKGTESLKEEILKDIGKEIEDLMVEVAKTIMGKQTEELKNFAEAAGQKFKQVDEGLETLQNRIERVAGYTFLNTVLSFEANNPGCLGREGRRELAKDLGIDLDGLIELAKERGLITEKGASETASEVAEGGGG